MDVEFTVEMLRTSLGVGVVGGALISIAVKPFLDRFSQNEDVMAWRGVIINLSALVICIALSLAAAAVFGFTYETGLQAFLTGLGGALVATGGFEVVKNVRIGVVGG